jgi:hypothetical protein
LQARVQSVAEELDEYYLDLQDLFDRGKATAAQVSNAFAKARAATAVASTLGDLLSTAAAETAYEAVCGIADSEEYFTAVARNALTK